MTEETKYLINRLKEAQEPKPMSLIGIMAFAHQYIASGICTDLNNAIEYMIELEEEKTTGLDGDADYDKWKDDQLFKDDK